MKRWWLPTQKGTQLWPRTTVQPPKLVIEGVETGTPLYHAVAARFAGRLQQFHGKAQQSYALSPNEVMRLRMHWDDGRASYVNIQGQEILRLEVDHKVVEAETKMPEVQQPWSWVIVETVIENWLSSLARASQWAQRELPEPTVEVVQGAQRGPRIGSGGIGLTAYMSKDEFEPPVIAYPFTDLGDEPGDNVISGTGSLDQVQAVLVDLRHHPVVEFDLLSHVVRRETVSPFPPIPGLPYTARLRFAAGYGAPPQHYTIFEGTYRRWSFSDSTYLMPYAFEHFMGPFTSVTPPNMGGTPVGGSLIGRITVAANRSIFRRSVEVSETGWRDGPEGIIVIE